jgi:hypothetical protein
MSQPDGAGDPGGAEAPPPLPELHQADLDRDTVQALFCDVAHGAELLEVRVKGGARDHAHEENPTLEGARIMLFEGEVRGVQLRYRHRGEEWCDTVLRAAGGRFRVVRIRAQ